MKDLKIYISAGSILLLVYLIAQFNKPNPVNWAATLSSGDKIPFGTHVLYNRLPDLFPGASVKKSNLSAYRAFNDSTLTNGNFFIIAKNVNLNKADLTAMIKYIAKGNSVFISALSWEGYIADSLKLDNEYEVEKKNAGLNFNSKYLKRAKSYKFDRFISDQYFSKFDTTKATVIGQNERGKANYIRYDFGKGRLYLFANPQVLTNYSLLKPDGADYVSKALSYLPAVKQIHWDQFQNKDIPEDESPMRVFLRYPALQWAYYLALAAMLIFIVYEAKRRQRIIPVVAPLKNTTLEFVTVVGKVYYEQRDNANIARKKISYFLDHIRTAHGLKPVDYNQEFTTAFAHKTGVDLAFAGDLLAHINYLLRQNKVTDHELIVLNRLIEKFYIQSGSYGK